MATRNSRQSYDEVRRIIFKAARNQRLYINYKTPSTQPVMLTTITLIRLPVADIICDTVWSIVRIFNFFVNRHNMYTHYRSQRLGNCSISCNNFQKFGWLKVNPNLTL